jgi:hypothetical protein
MAMRLSGYYDFAQQTLTHQEIVSHLVGDNIRSSI